MHRPGWVAVAAGLAASMMCVTALAGDYNWDKSAGNWFVAGNWSPQRQFPQSYDRMYIMRTGGGTCLFAGGSDTVSWVEVQTGNLLRQTGGTLTVWGTLFLGTGAGTGTGTYELSGAGAVLAANGILVGYGSTGVVNHSAGTCQVTDGSYLALGGSPASSQGIYNLSGGTLAVTGDIECGAGQVGRLNQTGGTAAASTGRVLVGRYGSASSGRYDLSAGTLQTQTLEVGGEGTGQFNWTGGNLLIGTAVKVHAGGALTVAQDWAFNRALTVDGGTLNLAGRALTLYDWSPCSAAATLSAGTLRAAELRLGSEATGALGVLTWTGGNLDADQVTLYPGGTFAVGLTASRSGPLHARGGKVDVASGRTFTLSGAFGVTLAGRTVTKAGAGTLVVTGVQNHAAGATLKAEAGLTVLETDAWGPPPEPPQQGEPELIVSAAGDAAVRLAVTQHLVGLALDAAATVTLSEGGSRVIVTRSLAFSGTPLGARLDLTDNNGIVDYPEEGPSPRNDVRDWVRAGINAGGTRWDGPGVTSTTARDDPWALTAVGMLDNTDWLIGGKADLEGEPVDATSVLVKYTYWGDANLDGQVTFDDYDVIDDYYSMDPPGERGWWTGDFDYDGDVDFDDYDLIDYAFWFQGGPLKAGGGGGEADAEAAEGEAAEAAEGGAAEAAEGGCPTTDEAAKAAAWAATDDPERAARHAKIRALVGWERTGPGYPPPRPEAETKE